MRHLLTAVLVLFAMNMAGAQEEARFITIGSTQILDVDVLLRENTFGESSAIIYATDMPRSRAGEFPAIVLDAGEVAKRIWQEDSTLTVEKKSVGDKTPLTISAGGFFFLADPGSSEFPYVALCEADYDVALYIDDAAVTKPIRIYIGLSLNTAEGVVEGSRVASYDIFVLVEDGIFGNSYGRKGGKLYIRKGKSGQPGNPGIGLASPQSAQ